MLIAKHKVGKDNEITFTKAKHLAGLSYYVSGEEIKRCPVGTNGSIDCYEVPMSKLETILEV